MFRAIKLKLTLLYQKPVILPLLIGFTYLCLLAETIKFPGFIGKHFFIDTKVYFALIILLLLVSSAKSKLLKLILKINLWVLILTLTVYLIFTFIEASNYPNYVFSIYHINMSGFFYVLLFGFSLFVIGKTGVKKSEFIKPKSLWNFVFIFLVAFTLIVNLGMSTQKALEENFYVFFHFNDTYDQKMYFNWENFYTYMVFVKNNTHKDATIVIPPQISPWWVRSGNLLLLRYFLYPRKMIQYGAELIPDVDLLPKGTYIMVAWGEFLCEQLGCHVWPIQAIKVREAVYKENNSASTKMIREDFLYDPKDKNIPFGLLKI